MCHIKTKSGIINSGDLSSLVTGLINRQCVPFNESQIAELVKYHSEGAMYCINDDDIEELIKARLDTLERNDYIVYRKGQYYPRALASCV